MKSLSEPCTHTKPAVARQCIEMLCRGSARQLAGTRRLRRSRMILFPGQARVAQRLVKKHRTRMMFAAGADPDDLRAGQPVGRLGKAGDGVQCAAAGCQRSRRAAAQGDDARAAG